jgi:hypothetical protein
MGQYPYTSNTNVASMRWKFTRMFEPGTVPDRKKQYSSGLYRPCGVVVSMAASWPGATAMDLSVQELADNEMFVPRESGVTILGVSILKSGAVGAREVSETLYRSDDYPTWVEGIINTELLPQLMNG